MLWAQLLARILLHLDLPHRPPPPTTPSAGPHPHFRYMCGVVYIELHCHSGYSFLDGASHPEELVHQAVRLGYPVLALTDHNGLYGSMEFAQLARASELQAITGAEVTLRECGIPGDAAGAEGEIPPLPHHALPHVTLLAETPAGYANLCRLLTQAHRTSPRREPSLPLSALLEHPEGLVLLTGCRQSPLLRHLDDTA